MRGPLALRVTVPHPYEDDVLLRLWELGTLGVEHRPDEGDRACLLAYFPAEAREHDLVLALRSIEALSVEPALVPDVDWVARFREGFRAFECAGFRIVPAWQPGVRPDADTLLVEPGQAFGTGTHESTRLCLQALRRLSASGPGLGRVLDVGTGSGILAVAALRLGATRAWGVDLDALALRSARRHAELNAVALPLVAADCGLGLRDGCCDTLLANLTAGLLLERQAELAALFTAAGRLVLSGLLEFDLPAIRAAYASFQPIEELREGEWAALVMARSAT